MKRYSLIVALHIIGIAFLSVGVYLLVDAGLWFSALMAFLILLAIAVHLYRLQMMHFRTRVLERNEMEAWQKLIRVLTHEIMNSITPIISLSETLSERT